MAEDGMSELMEALEREDAFHLRRAVERLREGLFDPTAVRLLTAHEERLNGLFDKGLESLDAGGSPHLCIVGSYGQGKSHSLTYLADRALRENLAVSMINLDPREIPLSDIRQVYRALMENLRLPDTDTPFDRHWQGVAGGRPGEFIPEEMPHAFKTILSGMALKNASLSEGQKSSPKFADFRPKEFPHLLASALHGEAVPLNRLKLILKYRQVGFYRDAPLTLRGVEPFIRMIRTLPLLLRRMDYRGWVLLFDEGESIIQTRVSSRAKAYANLHRLLFPEDGTGYIYPVFAFTEDFFEQVRSEDYSRVKVKGESELPYFERNFAAEWKDLTIYRLHDLSEKEWVELSRKLSRLHARAYGWMPPEEAVQERMRARLGDLKGQETRVKLKALVDQLDIAQQEQTLGMGTG